MTLPPACDEGAVSVERSGLDGSVLIVRMNHPPVNALASPVRDGLIRAAAQAHASDVRVVVLFGNDHCFSAGGDITELVRVKSDGESAALHEEYLELYRSWYQIPVPTIAGIRGYALGGALELILNCDLRYATPEAFFAASGVAMGLVESAHSLPGALCEAIAAEMLFTAARVPASQAYASGLLTRVVSDLDAEVAAIAHTIAAHPGAALRATKAVLRAARCGARADAQAVAVGHWRKLHRSREYEERATAFLAHRKE